MTKLTRKKLRRIPEAGWLGGVCSGFAYYFEIPVWITRVFWILVSFWMGWGIILYILFWIFMPEIEIPKDFDEVTDDF